LNASQSVADFLNLDLDEGDIAQAFVVVVHDGGGQSSR
jgi:hypothetical protein